MKKRLLVFLAFLMFVSNTMFAQANANVTITQQTGSACESVGVTVKDNAGEVIYITQALTDADGKLNFNFDFGSRAYGEYTVTANVDGKVTKNTVNYTSESISSGISIPGDGSAKPADVKIVELIPTKTGVELLAENTSPNAKALKVYKAIYKNGVLKGVEATDVTVSGSTEKTEYSADFNINAGGGYKTNYFVWDSAMKPYGTMKDTHMAWIDFNSDTSKNIEAFTANGSSLAKVTQSGQNGVLMSRKSGGTAEIYLDIDDECIANMSDGENSFVEIKYLDSGFGAFVLKYDGFSKRESESDVVKLENSGEWKTKKIFIPDGYYRNYYSGADLCLSFYSDKIGTTSDDTQETDVLIGAVDIYTNGTKSLVDIKTSSEAVGNVFTSSSDVKIDVTLKNAKVRPWQVNYNKEYAVVIDYVLKDYNGETLKTWSDTALMNPLFAKQKQVEIPVDKYGIYTLTVKASNKSLGIYNECDTKFSYSVDASEYKNDRLGISSGGTAELIAGAGFGWADYCMHINFFADNETKKFSMPEHYMETPKKLAEQGINVMTEIGANGRKEFEFASGEYAPTSSNGLEVYSDYCKFILNNLNSLNSSYVGKVFETWNEFDGGGNPAGYDYTNYVNFLKYAKEALPGATIVGPSSANNGEAILNKILPEGAGKYMDACSIHPYAWTQDPVSANIVGKVKRTREILNNYNCPNIPIWVTEIGWADGCYGVTTLEKGYYLVQIYTMLQEDSLVDKMFIYCFNDTSDTAGVRESNFDLINSTDYSAKPAYIMISAMNSILSGATYTGKSVTKNGDVYAYTFTDRNGKTVTVCWSVSGNASVTATSNGALAVYDVYGNNISETTGNVSLELTKAPVYVYGDIGALN